jgi:hypothetical protein
MQWSSGNNKYKHISNMYMGTIATNIRLPLSQLKVQLKKLFLTQLCSRGAKNSFFIEASVKPALWSVWAEAQLKNLALPSSSSTRHS